MTNNIRDIIQQNKRQNFDEYVPKWEFYLNSYIGGDDYTKCPGYLIKHTFETFEEFNRFKEHVFYPNYCKNIIDKMGRNIFRNPPIREHNELLLQAFSYRLIGNQITTNPNLFYRQLLQMLRVEGEIFTFFDHPHGNFNAVSDMQKKYRGLRYIEEILLPQHVPVYTENLVVLDLGNGIFKLWTPDEYIVYDKNGQPVPELSGDHDFGIIPISQHVIDKNIDGFGESDIRDPVKINNIIFNLWNRNWKTKIDESILTIFYPFSEELLAMYSILDQVNSETGKLDQNLKRKEYIPAGFEPIQLPKDVSMFADNREEIKSLSELIRQLTNQRSEVVLATSGESKKYDMENYISEQQLWSEVLQGIETEESIFKFENLLGIPVPTDFLIEYNRDFYPTDEALSNAEYKTIFDDTKMPKIAQKKARLQYCLNVLPLAPSEKKQLETELNIMYDNQDQTQLNTPDVLEEEEQLQSETIIKNQENQEVGNG